MEQAPKQWKRYNIFISSTFKDMDFERDIIKFRVIPALNTRFRSRRIELQAIDLRLGVNTQQMDEADSERKVLSVCASSIDSARPFFIGLVGARYGWIPPKQRWKEFVRNLDKADRSALRHTAGCSVTEMEIAYGALSSKSLESSHTLFYIRDDSSYDNMPEEVLKGFVDQEAEQQEKLRSLKEHIVSAMQDKGSSDDICTVYSLRYDRDSGTFTDTVFEKTVCEQLAAQIESECAGTQSDLSWWESEAESTAADMLRLCRDAMDMEMNGKWHHTELLTGEAGCGKSTLLALQFRDSLHEEDRITLCASIGRSCFSRDMRQVLTRWIMELCDIMGEEMPDDGILLEEPQLITLADKFYSLVRKSQDQDIQVWCFIDNIEALLESAPSELGLSWLNKDDGYFVLAAGSKAAPEILRCNPWLEETPVDEFSGGCAGLKGFMEKQYFIELPEEADAAAVRNPLHLRSAFRLLECAGQDDFEGIRKSSGKQIDAINGYMLRQWNSIPSDTGRLLGYMTGELLRIMQLPHGWKRVIALVMVSRTGLRMSDLETLAAEVWSGIDFARLMNFTGDFFSEDSITHLWRAHSISEDIVGAFGEKALYGQLAEHCSSLGEGDWLRESIGIYYCIRAGRADLAQEYLDGDTGNPLAGIPRFRLAQSFLLAEGAFMDGRLGEFCEMLEPDRKVQLMYGLFNADYRRIQQEQELMKLMCRLCSGDDSLLSDESLYRKAVMYGYCFSTDILEKSLSSALRCIDSRGFGWKGIGNTALINCGRLLEEYSRNKDIKGMERASVLMAALSSRKPEPAAGGKADMQQLQDYASSVCEPLYAMMVAKSRMRDLKGSAAIADQLLAKAGRLLEGYDIRDTSPSGEPMAKMHLAYLKYATNAAGAYQAASDNAMALRTFFEAFIRTREVLFGGLHYSFTLEMLLIIYTSISRLCHSLASPGIFSRKPRADRQKLRRMEAIALENSAWVCNRLRSIDPDNRLVRSMPLRNTGDTSSGQGPLFTTDKEFEVLGKEITQTI